MGVIFTISVIFLETLTAMLAFMAFCFLLREHHARRQQHLLYFALAFFLTALGFAGMFFGQVFEVYRDSPFSHVLVGSVNYTSSIAALFVFLGLLELYAARAKNGLLLLLAFAVPTASFTAAALLSSDIIQIEGLSVTALDVTRYGIIYGAQIAAALMLVVAGTRIHGKPDLHQKPDAFFAKAGILMLLMSGMNAFAIIFEIAGMYPAGIVVNIVALVFLFFGAVAKDDPDPVVADRPVAFFSRRLILKAAALNVTLFWLLAYLLLAVTSTYFVTGSIDGRKLGLRRDVHFFSRTLASSGVLFLEETSRLAELPSLPAMIGTDPSKVPPVIKDFLQKGNSRRIMRIVDGDGKIVFSSFSQKEVGTLLDSAVMRKALAGQKVAATERETAIDAWTLRAAVPVGLGGQADGGVILATDISAALDFSDYLAISPVLASGYGYVTETGDIAYASGEPVDEVTKSGFIRLLGAKVSYVGETTDGDNVFIEHTYATDGAPNGFFYVLLRHGMLDAEVFRILAVVMIIVFLALVFMTAILLFVISTVLRPIKQLRAASMRVEKGEYEVRVQYDSPDELGELSRAFNRMSSAIADRTTSLRQAIREQQDFLEHSVRDMRTPLNIFRWTLELMRFGDTGRMTREQLELLEQMNQTNERLIRMTQNLQDVSRLDRGKLPIKQEFFQIEDAIDEAAGETAVSFHEKNLTFHWNRPKPKMPRVRADRAATKKILLNILSNATKYNQPNGHIELQLTQTDEDRPGGRKGKFLKVAVEDSGRGIPKEEHGRVFSRFFRAKNVLSEEIEGAGLGLYIAKKLTELQGGRIWFDSKEGVGSTFTFTVPVDPKYDEHTDPNI